MYDMRMVTFMTRREKCAKGTIICGNNRIAWCSCDYVDLLVAK